MRVLFRILALVLALADPASARELRMTSGEHATFSRIILFMDVPGPWAFGRTETGYGLRFHGDPAELDLSEVFYFIPRKRVARIAFRREENTVLFELACDCHADAFELHNGHIALDFKDGPPPPAARFEAALAMPAVLPEPKPAEPAEAPPLFDVGLDTGRKSALQSSLARGLANAVADGLVEPVMPQRVEPAGPEEKDDILDHLTIATQIDLSRAGRAGGDPVPGAACRDAGPFAFASSEQAPFRVLGALRREIVDDRLRQSPKAFEALAEQYLYMGFGAEAAQVLTLAAAGPEYTRDLMAIARLMDGNGTPSEAFPGDQIDCGTALSLWAFLATGQPQPLTDKARARILGTFFAMPDHLRAHLGPRLAQRFRDLGDMPALSELKGGLDRRGQADELPPHLLTGLATRAERAGQMPEIQALAAGNSPYAADALIALAETYLEGTGQIPPSLPTDLAARAYELRGAENGPRLNALALEARIAAGEYREAAERLAESENPRLRQALVPKLVTDAGDAVLAELFFGYPGLFDPVGIPPETVRLLGERMVAMGLRDEALTPQVSPDPMSRAPDLPKRGVPGLAPALLDTADAEVPDRDALARLLDAAGSNRARVTDFIAQFQVPR